ncbi:alkaline phosphatase family protein [Lacihabitans sp. LS3-19]|uniref:alkaline phosphatase family protein n=1 Tax=Lacihabitans sp. LS3-19 TaxID=2487335 RepID=UPI0020CCB0CF|nr:ectonucleotide pyrophosphatase/phosphodiesterase [Lacihabitans sp. LS3-19]MCP9768317.1 alkaline phosphatase family protein [Lacihabitans sp. LS3-19]
MRILLSFLACLTYTFVFSQQPTYDEILQKEILSNTIENNEASLQKPYVIMVSIDGFRHDYAEKYQAKNILKIAEEGSSSTRLIPSFPSKTFPNHYSLVTGLYPEHHGIVSNAFYDKSTQKEYAIGNRTEVVDGKWYGGIPLWNLAQTQGMCAASYFWVGSEANINGLFPKYYYPYQKTAPYEYRIQRVLEWLQMPEKTRPHFITLYFSMVDTQGHNFGPDAKETKEAVLYVDQQIGALREGLKKLNLPVTLIVSSDHGMVNVSKYLNVHDYIEMDKKQFYSGPVAMIYTKTEEEKEKFYDALSTQTQFKVYKREAVPNYLNYSENERIGDLVLVADPPYTIVYSEKEMVDKPGGTHGYDPFENKEMGAIFYIEGPTIKKNFKLAPIENVNIYPLVAHILGLNISEKIDGKLETTAGVLIEK